MRLANSIPFRLWASLALWMLANSAQSALVHVEANVWRDTETSLEWLSVNLTTTVALGFTDPNDPLSTTTCAAIMGRSRRATMWLRRGFVALFCWS